MIVTVTMNPAVDKTAFLGKLCPGELNRADQVILDAGGKGINVSKTIAALGGSSIASGFCGGGTGQWIEASLKASGISTDFIHVEGATRTNCKIVERGGRLTELNESGCAVSREDFDRLSKKLSQYAGSGVLFVLSGSVPPGVTPEAYAGLIRGLREAGAEVFLDADGVLFQKGMEARPDYIKPNRAEALQFLMLPDQASEEELLKASERFRKFGIRLGAVSLGDKGSFFLTEQGICRVQALPVRAGSCVGAGDAMAAAMCMGLEQKMAVEELISFAAAVSAGAVETEGTKPPSLSRVRELESLVKQEWIFDC